MSAETYEQQTGKDVMPETKNDVYDNEPSLGALIGAALVRQLTKVTPDEAPSYMASNTDGHHLSWPVSGGSEETGRGDAGWAPKKKLQIQELIVQVKGILTLALNLNGNAEDMLLRYRAKLEAAGEDVAIFDQAVVIARPMVPTVKHRPPSKKKSRGRR